jgi:hypothetical protein
VAAVVFHGAVAVVSLLNLFEGSSLAVRGMEALVQEEDAASFKMNWKEVMSAWQARPTPQ